MSKSPPPVTLSVKGAWATVAGCSIGKILSCMQDVANPLDPNRNHMRAFREQRWDGRIPLFNGRAFPAGLCERAKLWFNAAGHDVTIETPDIGEIDTSWMGRDYLPAHGKFTGEFWDHQYEAIMAMFESPRGIVRIPTGGGKTAVMAALARYLWEEKNWRSLIVTSKKGLAAQTVETFCGFYQGDILVGQIGDGKRETDGDIIVATAQSLNHFRPHKRKGKIVPGDAEYRDIVENFEVLMLDEAHHSSSDSWYEIGMASGAMLRWGLSATPFKNEELSDTRIRAATGEIIYEVDTDALVDLGLTARPRIAMVMSDNASGRILPKVIKVSRKGNHYESEMPYHDAYVEGIIENDTHNRSVVRAVQYLTEVKGRQTLVLCRRKDHWNRLHLLLEEFGVKHYAVWGDTATPDRNLVKKLMGEGTANCVVATTIWDEGEDVNGIDALVLAEGVKSVTNVLQRLGRSMRRDKGFDDVLVVDFAPTCHKKLLEHALARAEAYESEGHAVTLVEDWPPPESPMIPEAAISLF